MKLAVPYAFPTDVSYRMPSGRHSTRTYYFRREREVTIPEYASREAPVVVMHRPFRREGEAAGLVAFRRIADVMYEPARAAEGRDPLASLVFAMPDCKGTMWDAKDGLRFAGKSSKVWPDPSREREAEKEVAETVAQFAYVDGVLHRASWEPMLVLRDDDTVTTAPDTPYWSVADPSRRFRLDEVGLLSRTLEAKGVDAATLRQVQGTFAVVDATLLASDFRTMAMVAALGNACRALAKRLHDRPRPSVEAYLSARRVARLKDDGPSAVAAMSNALDLAIGAFDGGMDDEAARAEAAMAMRVFLARGGVERVEEDIALLALGGVP